MPRTLPFIFVYVSLGIALSALGCREEENGVINKLDPRLKIQVEKLEGTMLSVIMRTAAALDDAQVATLENRGVVIQSHTGTIYVCRIPLRSVLPVAREKFVVRLEAPKVLKPQ